MTQGHDNQAPDGAIDVSFDTLARLLGGARAAEALADHADAAPHIAALDGPAAWLTPGTDATTPSAGTIRQLALEVLSLKLRTFAAIVDQVPPQLPSLPPEHVRVQLLDGTGLPGARRWNVHVSLVAGGGAPADRAAGADAGLRTSLGLLLARLLFESDRRRGDEAQQHGVGLASTFATGSGTSPAENAERLFANGPGGDSSVVLFSLEHRDLLTGKALPAGLWAQVGGLLLRLLTDVSEFSLPDPPIDALRPRLAQLIRRLDIATFGAIARRDEISDLLRQNLARLKQD
jgi:hypothetical protein